MKLEIDTKDLEQFSKLIKESSNLVEDAITKTIQEGIQILYTNTVRLTPVYTGYLRNNWLISDGFYKGIIKNNSEYYLELYNNTHYAEYVETGHRTRNGNWWEGFHMLEKSENYLSVIAHDLLLKNLKNIENKFR